MTSWKSVRNWARGALVTAASVLAMAQAEAYTVSLAPAAQTVELGSVVAIDVIVSGLGGTGLGSYSLNLGFDAGILAFDRAVDSFNLGDSVGLFVTPDLAALVLTDVSFDDPDLLRARQGDTVTLLTLYFNTLALGTADLGFTAGSALSDVYGDAVDFLTLGGAVTVIEGGGGGGNLPLPGSLPLVLAAAAAALLVRRRATSTR